MNEREYRRAVAQAKKRLSDEDVFLSEKYVKLLIRIAQRITSKRMQNIQMVNDPQKLPAWYDGHRIVVNLANPITKSFPNKELKNKSLIGLLGHECGHEIYSSVEKRREYLQILSSERRFYPEIPAAENDDERKNLLSIQEEFQRRDSAAVQVMCTLANYLENMLEDIYIEHKMCRDFPGSIREGIYLNNMRKSEKIRSVNEQLADGKESSLVMLGMFMQYAVCGYVNCWDGCEERYWECLKKCAPVIEGAVFSQRPDARFRATNKLLLLLWDFILADAKKIEKEAHEETELKKHPKEEPENNHEGKEKADENEEGAGPEACGCGKENAKEAGRQPACNDTDIDPDTEPAAGAGAVQQPGVCAQECEQTEAAVQAQEELIQKMFGKLQHALMEEGEDTKTEVQRPAAIKPEGGDRIGKRSPLIIQQLDSRLDLQKQDKVQCDCDEEVSVFLHDMARERVDEEWTRELHKQYRKWQEEIDMGEANTDVPIRILRGGESLEEGENRFEDARGQVNQIKRKLYMQVLPLLERKKTRMEQGMAIGRKIDHQGLYRPDRKIFGQRHLEDAAPDAAVAVLNDLSGSMCFSDRIDQARIASLVLYEFCQEAGIPILIYGHDAKCIASTKETVVMHSIAEFDSMDAKDRYRIMGMNAGCNNRDGVAVRFVGEILKRRPEKQKLMILISDGLPEAEKYYGKLAKEDLKAAKQELEKHQIMFLAAAIGQDKDSIREIYEDAFLDISDIKELPKRLMIQLVKKIGL